jgi:SAM-dependent methyltransferase
VIRRLVKYRVLNNRFINPILKIFKLDAWLNDRLQDYRDFKPNLSLSLQEIAGYSYKPEINRILENIHIKLRQYVLIEKQRLSADTFSILDIGCGPGLFLKDFDGIGQLNGIDISSAMTTIARKEMPSAKIANAHFLDYEFEQKFSVIYSVGVLIYFAKSQIHDFFDKVHQLLANKGLAIISYPHAYRSIDLSYPDFTYVHYSPSYLEAIVDGKFEIIEHVHIDGKRKITDYDKHPIINDWSYEGRSYQNSSILVIRKK